MDWDENLKVTRDCVWYMRKDEGSEIRMSRGLTLQEWKGDSSVTETIQKL